MIQCTVYDPIAENTINVNNYLNLLFDFPFSLASFRCFRRCSLIYKLKRKALSL